MLLTITTTHSPATDLGFLLHKNPERHQVRAELRYRPRLLPGGIRRPLHRGAVGRRRPCWARPKPSRSGGNDFSLAQYVNDRPYAASSFMSVALAKMFSTAMSGRSKERPELAEQAIPLEAATPGLPCPRRRGLLRRLFEPLGYQVDATAIPLDREFPALG